MWREYRSRYPGSGWLVDIPIAQCASNYLCMCDRYVCSFYQTFCRLIQESCWLFSVFTFFYLSYCFSPSTYFFLWILSFLQWCFSFMAVEGGDHPPCFLLHLFRHPYCVVYLSREPENTACKHEYWRGSPMCFLLVVDAESYDRPRYTSTDL